MGGAQQLQRAARLVTIVMLVAWTAHAMPCTLSLMYRTAISLLANMPDATEHASIDMFCAFTQAGGGSTASADDALAALRAENAELRQVKLEL
jgi:hypothetical protein